jgi:hypothetical protein
MATFTVRVKQQQRIDTAANWTTKNPTLLVGELGIESDTGKIKCGNGVAKWSSLSYIGVTTEYLEANYVKKTGNAASATKLLTARTIALSGGATGTATSFNGTANIAIPVTSIDASKLTGTAAVNTTGKSASSDKLNHADTRSVNSAPSVYMAMGAGEVCEFKNNSTIGLSVSDMYSQVLTIIRWGDSSGGYPVQYAVNSQGTYRRYGTGDSTWSTWVRMVTAAELTGANITVTARSGLGNNTNLDSVLNFISNVFLGSQSVSKIKASTFDTTS